jgi:hypothetical protein
VKRILVVANQTLGGDELMSQLKARVADGSCEIHVVVPASADPTSSFHDHASDRALATGRLTEALSRFTKLGVDVTGEVGDHRPVDAVTDVFRRGESFDEIVVSTLPVGASRWVRLDAVSKIERAVDTPVTHVVAEPTHTSSGRR